MKEILLSLAVASVLVFGASLVRAEEVLHFGEVVDRQSPLKCILCHEGIRAKEVKFCKSNCDITASHPAFKKYPPEGKDNYFKPAEKLTAAGLRLMDGQITCVTCHDLRKKTEYFLAIPRKDGKLCKTCHKKFWER